MYPDRQSQSPEPAIASAACPDPSSSPTASSSTRVGKRISQTKPLFVSCSGVSCLPWTSEGGSEGKASPCEVPHAVWLAERVQLALEQREDIFSLEQESAGPAQGDPQDRVRR